MNRFFPSLIPILFGTALLMTSVLVRNAEIPPPVPVEERHLEPLPVVADARAELLAAEERHQQRFRDAVDPAAAEKNRADRLLAASSNPEALAAIGQELFVLDFPRTRSPKTLAETTRCQSCHYRGGPGGAGGLVDNYYERRNPTALRGAALLERLAAQLTADIQRDAAEGAALTVQGVSFGTRDRPRGIAKDLVVRPFGRTGRWATLDEAIADMGSATMGVAFKPAERQALAAFIGSLPAPGLVPPDPIAAPDIYTRYLEGRLVFEKVGCSGCHVPEWRLADGTVVAAYSDFKKHDMGDALADGDVREWLTPPLWGLSASQPWLHDGRALASVQAAIIAHDGEALETRKAYEALSPDDQRRIRVFLLSLAPVPRMRVAGQ